LWGFRAAGYWVKDSLGKNGGVEWGKEIGKRSPMVTFRSRDPLRVCAERSGAGLRAFRSPSANQKRIEGTCSQRAPHWLSFCTSATLHSHASILTGRFHQISIPTPDSRLCVLDVFQGWPSDGRQPRVPHTLTTNVTNRDVLPNPSCTPSILHNSLSNPAPPSLL
jgi:hypothetical protein